MKVRLTLMAVLLLLLLELPVGITAADGDEKTPANTVAVHMVATVEPLKDDDKTIPGLKPEDVMVKQGKNRVKVTGWVPSRGQQGGLQLLILIDETSDTSLGSQLADLREFMQAQAPTTAIGIGYMRNATVDIVQNFTTDHGEAAKRLRLPLGTLSSSDSPYLSLITVLKGWPQSKLRREVLMIGDGIDRLRGTYGAGSGSLSARAPSARSPLMGSMQPLPEISPDIETASRAAQRYGVIVHSIYTRGVGHAGRNLWEITNGQNGLSKLADETGGEAFYLGAQNAVSFKPYLERLQTILDNQYFLVFQAVPGKKPDLQRIRTSTEIPKVEIVTADNVWVPAAHVGG
jgi:hypothetical protein